MPECELTAGKMKKERGYADAQTVRTRLTSLARSLHRLPEMVQQRQQQATQCSLRCSYSNPSGQEYRDTLEATPSDEAAGYPNAEIKALPDLHNFGSSDYSHIQLT
ncbi:hypothetical protein PInf_011002 [Phytophthora infestans]|nr:hypothetical protein PInf_011002 [Phytophthora infestans]